MSVQGARYFHTDDPVTLEYLRSVIDQAIEHGQGVCIDVDAQHLSIKRGGSGWTAPFYGTPHMSRDV